MKRQATRMGQLGRAAAIAAGTALAFGAGSASAHHAIGGTYDLGKTGTLKGVLTKVDWSNPHAWFHFDVKAADGSIKKWATESTCCTAALSKRRWPIITAR